jgi:hypothetical protein
MRAPVVQGAQINNALAELLKSTVTLPSEEADVLQVGVNFLHRSFTMMHMFVLFLAAFDDPATFRLSLLAADNVCARVTRVLLPCRRSCAACHNRDQSPACCILHTILCK